MILLKIEKVFHAFHLEDGHNFSLDLRFSRTKLSTTSIIEFSELKGILEDI